MVITFHRCHQQIFGVIYLMLFDDGEAHEWTWFCLDSTLGWKHCCCVLASGPFFFWSVSFAGCRISCKISVCSEGSGPTSAKSYELFFQLAVRMVHDTTLILVCFKSGPKLIGGTRTGNTSIWAYSCWIPTSKTVQIKYISSRIYKLHLKNRDKLNWTFRHYLYRTCSHVFH